VNEDRKARLAEKNFWDEIIALRDRQRAERKNGMQVLKRGDLPVETNRQGLMRWYMHPEIKDTVLSTHLCFEQEIPPGSRTGRLKFQGGQVIYVIAGRGYTLLDGVKHPWAAGDVIDLPLRRGGIIVQHFNDDDTAPARFLAVEVNWLESASVDRGSGFEQLEDAPEFRRGGTPV
jgi:hypothetical protein